MTQINQRRVEALESIGESCKVVSLLKKKSEVKTPIERTPVQDISTGTKPKMQESVDEDEVSMWSKIVTKNIRSIENTMLREDLMDHILLFVHKAKRGTWTGAPSFVTPPRLISTTPVRPSSVFCAHPRALPSQACTTGPSATEGSLRTVMETALNEDDTCTNTTPSRPNRVMSSVEVTTPTKTINEQMLHRQIGTTGQFVGETFQYQGGFFPYGAFESHPSYTTL